MKLTKDEVEELTWHGLDGFKVLEDEVVDTGRWSIYYRLVFEKDGQLWAFDYERGATEYQEVDQPDEVECYEVEAVPSVTYRTKPKPLAAVPAPPPPPPPPPFGGAR